MSKPADLRLLLDEMFSPAIAAALRDLGHDVVAVAERAELRAIADEDVFAWAAAQSRWLLTENVKDFRPILLRALQADAATVGVLYTSSRTFPRSRKNPGPLIQALHAWLRAGPPAAPLTEDWLLDPRSPG
jgi:Domain of unknown function (DUF5615)